MCEKSTPTYIICWPFYESYVAYSLDLWNILSVGPRLPHIAPGQLLASSWVPQAAQGCPENLPAGPKDAAGAQRTAGWEDFGGRLGPDDPKALAAGSRGPFSFNSPGRGQVKGRGLTAPSTDWGSDGRGLGLRQLARSLGWGQEASMAGSHRGCRSPGGVRHPRPGLKNVRTGPAGRQGNYGAWPGVPWVPSPQPGGGGRHFSRNRGVCGVICGTYPNLQ